MTTRVSQTMQRKPTEPLTSEQQQTVADNLNLVFFFCRKYKPPYGLDADDWQGEVMVELVRSVQYHDPARGKLSTIMDRFVFTRRGHLNTYNRRGTRGRVVNYSLDEDVSLLDMAGRDHHWPKVDAAMVTEQALSHCSEQEADALRKLAEGFNHREIAKHYGLSHQRVSQLLENARCRIASKMPGELVQTTQCERCGGSSQQYSQVRNFYCSRCSTEIRNKRKLDYERERMRRKRLAKIHDGN